MKNYEKIPEWLKTHTPDIHHYTMMQKYDFLFMTGNGGAYQMVDESFNLDIFNRCLKFITENINDFDEEDLIRVLDLTTMFRCENCPANKGAKLITDFGERNEFCKSIGGCDRFKLEWTNKEIEE